MKDTTFWPGEEQAARIAKSYKPGPGNQGLEETTIGQLYYPLTDRTQRFPMPAGGLILIWLVQHAGFPGEGNKSQDTFKRAAFEVFAPAQK